MYFVGGFECTRALTSETWCPGRPPVAFQDPFIPPMPARATHGGGGGGAGGKGAGVEGAEAESGTKEKVDKMQSLIVNN